MDLIFSHVAQVVGDYIEERYGRTAAVTVTMLMIAVPPLILIATIWWITR